MYQSDARAKHDQTVFPAANWGIETLEKRLMLTGLLKGAFDLNKVPVFNPTSTDVTNVKAGPLAKSGGLVAGVYNEYQSFVNDGGSPEAFVSKQNKFLVMKNDMIALTIRTRGGMGPLADTIHGLGGYLIDRASNMRVIEAFLPIAKLVQLDTNPSITSANPLVRPRTATEGKADNQGDIAENADELRTAFSATGAGVKVGVISDSVSQFNGGLADSVTTGDLPNNVQVVEDGSPGDTDEGRAMLEEIHDVTPDASLAFAAGGPSQLHMARNVVGLADAGAKVIVDDLAFFAEPAFQPSVIGQAISSVTHDHDVVYLSAAGNEGNGAFSAKTQFVNTPDGETLVNFAPGGGTDTRLRLTLTNPTLLILQWDDPYDGVVGAAATDLDIVFRNVVDGGFAGESTDNNLATGVPVDMLSTFGAGQVDIEIRVAASTPGAALPTFFRLATFDQSLVDPEYDGLRNGAFGHNAAADMLSVGAAPFFGTRNYQHKQPVRNEDFSATGPIAILLGANGERLHKGQYLMKPDLTGIDGVNTSFFGSPDVTQDPDKLRNFFGTSAAAPNVAAVAALLRQINPGATSSDIRNALIEAAKTNPINGQTPGQWDPQAGFGLIDGLSAGRAILPGNTTSDIVDVFPHSQPVGPSSMTITFGETVTGFDISDLVLTRDGGANLLTGSQTLSTTDNQTFLLSGLGPLTTTRGTYTLNLDTGSAGIIAADGMPPRSSSETFVVTGRPTPVQATPVTPTQIDLTWSDLTDNESGFKIVRSPDINFAQSVKTFIVPANTTKFSDTKLHVNTQYFYKVQAMLDPAAGTSTVSDEVDAFTLTDNQVIIDNEPTNAIAIGGSWDLLPGFGDSWSVDYLASNANSGSVTFTPRLGVTGKYFVYARWVPGADRASNAAFTVAGKRVTVNEQQGTGWQLLGTFNLKEGRKAQVVVDPTGANGTVVVDAIRFQPTSGGVTISSAAPSTSVFNSGAPISASKEDLKSLI